MSRSFFYLVFSFLFLASFVVHTIAATTKKVTTPPFKVATWLPYWKPDDSVNEALLHIDKIDELSPFAYTVKFDGTLKDNFASDTEPWSLLMDTAYRKHKLVYPTVLWTDSVNMHLILSNKTKRKKHIDSIIETVTENKYNGIDIDYEGKSAETRVVFSNFLKELSIALHKKSKKLVCTIEARTPIDSRYKVITKDLLDNIEYANDYKVIGHVCDMVRIMTYDQIDGDVKLTDQNFGSLYRPVSDIEWVKKVLNLALFDIPAKKVYVGVPTYGYKYEIIQPTGTSTALQYKRIGSMNFNYADGLAKSLNITPSRKGGEAYFSYSTSTDINGQSLGTMKQYLVWYSDAQAISQKVELAKLYKLGGVAIFKVDGANDPNLWNIIK